MSDERFVKIVGNALQLAHDVAEWGIETAKISPKTTFG